MVGVAGKSKGCTTCRRRKIRCGQQTPHCLNCIQSGRLCEGYERYPIFINRTADGLQKRRPLEEAKSRSSVSESQAGVPARQATVLGSTAHVPSSVVNLPSSPSTHAVWSAGFLGWFWENYSPADAPSGRFVKRPIWIYHAINIPQPTAALHQALLALAILRRGRVHDDKVLVVEGQRTYGRALVHLQKAIYDPQVASDEETLAATRALVLYELYEATSNTPTSWQSHVVGLATLMKSRGPYSYGTPLARAVFEEFRYPLMIQCIIQRKSTVFAEPIWCTAPWVNVTKDAEQELFDLGFSIACLLEQADSLARVAGQNDSCSVRLDSMLQVIKSTLEINDALDQFRDTHLVLPSSAADETMMPLTGEALDLELLLMNWWTIKWIVAFTGSRLALKARVIISRLPPPSQVLIRSLTEQLWRFCNDAVRDKIGHSLLASLQRAVEGQVDQFGMSRAIFPLTAATFQFSHSPPELEICQRLKGKIAGRQGFRFATGVEDRPAVQKVFVEQPR